MCFHISVPDIPHVIVIALTTVNVAELSRLESVMGYYICA